ncbi:EAL domain-containing protein [Halomonas sp. 1390]|uniref:bifunctional diguanylate cyclase/phosphodiesterase n=1 Tax=Halomonas sp. B23F22_3 TaxID=3459516 RepID=UPI00373EDF8A
MKDSPRTAGTRHGWPRLHAIGTYLLALLALAAFLAWVLVDRHQHALDRSWERAGARTDLVAEWVAGAFAASEERLSSLARLLESPMRRNLLERQGSVSGLEARLSQQQDRLEVIDSIAVVGPDGRVITATDPAFPAGKDLGRESWFGALVDRPDLDHRVSTLTWSAATRQYHLVDAHRLDDEDGNFSGLVVAFLDPAVLGDTLARLDLASGESIAILDTDMRLLARWPAIDVGGTTGIVGRQVSEPMTQTFLESGQPSTRLRIVSPLDDSERLFAMQRLADLPLLVVVGESLDGALSDWFHRLWLLVGVYLLVAVLGGWLLRHYLHLRRLEAELRWRLEEREQARRSVLEREAQLRALVGSIQDMIFVFDAEGRFVYVHTVDRDQLVGDAGALLQRHYREVLSADVARQLDRALDELRASGEPVEFDYRVTLAGVPRDFHAILSSLDEGGALGGVLAVVREVTETRATEAQLRIAAMAFETHLGMLVTDERGAILRVNETFTRITGYAEAEVLGHDPSLLSSGRHDDAFYEALWESVQRHGSWQGEIWNRRKNGEIFPEWLTISAVRDDAGELTHYVATFNDITRRKAAEEEIHQLAFFDPLTGLPNRRLMLDRLSGALKDSYRSGQFGALFYLDLDNFQRVNDTRGHRVGDDLLQQVARRLNRVLRETDTLARLGGDEFAVLLHDLGGDQAHVAVVAERIAYKLLGTLRSPMRLADDELSVTASLGITLYRERETTLEQVLQQADMALYKAKEAGRDTLRFFDPAMQAQLQQRARLEADLRQALSRGEFLLHYQPQVGGDGRMIGAEALLRWSHPTRGMVSPAEFIPLAEENRLIVPIGGWVLETACRQLAAWASDPAMAELTLSVNVSPEQFREPGFAEQTLSILSRTGARPSRLKLEVTESLFVHDRDEARQTMQRLKAHGVTFALDDFGTGYSSLSYLKRLPLDQLKIDQSFVRDLLEDEASAAIVASTIALSRSLQLEVLAEGVENEAQRAWLTAHGCAAFQGYLFSRPVPVEALAATCPAT